MLIDVTHDELHDPGDVTSRLTLLEADAVEWFIGQRPHQRGDVLSGDNQEAERVVLWRQSQPGAPLPIQFVGDFPTEDERILANEHLLDPAPWSHDALTDVVRDLAHGPALTTAWQFPLFGRERPQQLPQPREPR